MPAAGAHCHDDSNTTGEHRANKLAIKVTEPCSSWAGMCTPPCRARARWCASARAFRGSPRRNGTIARRRFLPLPFSLHAV
eukprot:scaffold195820_cov30-Tisochrysis_lutea.AAC.4